MNKLFACLMLALPLVVAPAMAQDKKDAPKKELTEQQKKMGSCSSQAKGLKGDEYKKKRDDCLKGEKDAKSANQSKFGKCNSDLKGQKMSRDERNAKVKECMAKS